MKRSKAGILAGAILCCLAAFLFLRRPEKLRSTDLIPPDGKYNVRILRDTWGVPHVFGKTDADVAYGLAYAHAEDDFRNIQNSLLAARGILASVYGKDMAPNDYMVQLLRIWTFVDAGYDTRLDARTRAICEAYADGINHYAALHESDAIPALFPMHGKDIVAGFVHKMPLFFGMDQVLKSLFDETASAATAAIVVPGSNTFAVAPSRSADGATRLAINSHQPWEGPVAWYEAHLHSEEGWDMVGGVFPGAPIVLHGHNRNLGWAHTVNHPDLIDVFQLEINPANKNQYRFDGAWKDLEVATAKIRVKIWGRIHWTFSREILWSVYGPAVRNSRGTFAINYAGKGDIRQVEQWYRMNKAQNLAEWEDAMRMQALPMFNCGYADRAGNILYLYNALLPARDENYDWQGTVPGNTSKTLWEKYLTYEKLPRVLNPPSGFVQNCNSTPFQTTIGEGNPVSSEYSPAFGIDPQMTNRSYRALELFGTDSSITPGEFDQYKFDRTYSASSEVARRVKQLVEMTPAEGLEKEAIGVLRNWNLRTDSDNRSAALALLTLQPDYKNTAIPEDTQVLFKRLKESAGELKKAYGRIDVPLGNVVHLKHGDVDLPLEGGPDVPGAIYSEKVSDGHYRGVAGDSYILIVSWDRNGNVSSRSIHQYGSATSNPSSPHYADQAPLFARHELKPVWMDEAEIRLHLEREYRP